MEYIPNTPQEASAMARRIGADSLEDLYADVPQNVRCARPLAVGEGMSELALVRELKRIAAKNRVYDTIFMGAGAYAHFIPAAVDNLSARNEFVTAYTPYQAEMSQGILQSIFEFQTMICELTGMDVSNASVYDGASAAGEACLMVRDRKRSRMLVSAAAHPQVIQTMRTYAVPAGMEFEIVPEKDGATDMDVLKTMLDETVAGVFLSSPNYYGIIEDAAAVSGLAHEAGAKCILGVNPFAAVLLHSAAELGADIAVGEGQPLGIPLSFGGPYLGFMACSKALMRKLPGRIVGETVDDAGRRAFVLTLQAREQHIRREKAGSNICSNQAWCALRSAIYMSLMGSCGMREVAEQCYANTHYLRDELKKAGFEPVYGKEFFHEFVTKSPIEPRRLQEVLDRKNILGGLDIGGGNILWCATELTGKNEIDELIGAIKGAYEK
ncbi:glycine dehydrogenase [Christensenellaceae bacterium]|nr:glycine dehydrogenase [Christensenellaceae bacterium]BDF60198.1 glycine dehydrogenase [Christensenellaceae bacterium]